MKPSLIRIILIAAVLGTTIFAAYFGWRAFFVSNASKALVPDLPAGGIFPAEPGGGAENSEERNSAQEISSEGKVQLERISNAPASDFWINLLTDEVFYLTEDGRVFKVNEKEDTEISRQTLGPLNSATPSRSGESMLVSFGGRENPRWAIFDAASGAWHPLPSGIRAAAWGRNSDEIFAVVTQNGTRPLVRMDLSKTPLSSQTILRDLNLEEVALAFRESPDALVISEPPSARIASRTWLLDLSPKTPTLATLFPPAYRFTVAVSNGGTLYLASGEQFRILDAETKENAFLLPFHTLSGKCATELTSDGDFAWCFVPRSSLAEVAAAEDYRRRKTFSVDTLYALDIYNDELLKVFESGVDDVPAIDAEKPRYGRGGVYFINRYDNLVYRLRLNADSD
ncbi:MAG: hypothetical protein HYU81_01760 [Candidatus Brennerbacteria bacterium]|nr:hypothetical protein [Candidatus Brennerbacteria bacterium]